MKNIFYVKKRTLLLIAGIVWLLAGFNVARLGVLSYLSIDRKWYLYLMTLVVVCMFGSMFYKMSKKHTKRIMGYESHRPFWHFFDLKAFNHGLYDEHGYRLQSARHIPRQVRCIFLFGSRLRAGLGRCAVH